MPYSQNDIDHITELVREIESRKEHSNAAATYKDVPALREIDRIVNAQLDIKTPDCDTLEDSIGAMRYLGNSYEYMWRIAYANQYYKKLLELQAELFRRFDRIDEEIRNDYYVALRARNYYGPDRCDDLVETAKELLSEDERKKIEKKIFEDFHPLKHDPVELTKPYLSVIDKVEQLMDTEEIKSMHHFQRNDVFRGLLREYGVEWRPMTELNPGVHFD